MSTALTRPRVDELRADARAAVLGLRNGEVAPHAVLADLEREKALATGAYRAIVRSLAAALEARDGYTGDHSDAVHELSQRVALQLGLDEHPLEEIRTVALLHDVGKIGVPDAILHKAGPSRRYTGSPTTPTCGRCCRAASPTAPRSTTRPPSVTRSRCCASSTRLPRSPSR